MRRIEYRGYLIEGSGQTIYSIWKDDVLVGSENYIRYARAWVDGEISDQRAREAGLRVEVNDDGIITVQAEEKDT